MAVQQAILPWWLNPAGFLEVMVALAEGRRTELQLASLAEAVKRCGALLTLGALGGAQQAVRRGAEAPAAAGATAADGGPMLEPGRIQRPASSPCGQAPLPPGFGAARSLLFCSSLSAELFASGLPGWRVLTDLATCGKPIGASEAQSLQGGRCR